jgi:hypothetical protein
VVVDAEVVVVVVGHGLLTLTLTLTFTLTLTKKYLKSFEEGVRGRSFSSEKFLPRGLLRERLTRAGCWRR